jgi:hypothetical protein
VCVYVVCTYVCTRVCMPVCTHVYACVFTLARVLPPCSPTGPTNSMDNERIFFYVRIALDLTANTARSIK